MQVQDERNQASDSDFRRLINQLQPPPTQLSAAPTQANFLKVLPNNMDSGIISNTLYTNYFGTLYSQTLTVAP